MPLYPAVLRDAVALFQRDRDLLLRLAAPFLFLPAYALALLVPPPPAAEGSGEAAALAWADALSNWAGAHGGWYLLAYAVGCVGLSALYASYLDPRAPDLRSALRLALRIAPRFLLAMAVVALPVAAGLLLWVLPGLYVLGRTLLVGPVLVAEPGTGALAAIGRSFRLTRGRGMVAMSWAATVVVGGYLAGAPFALIDSGLRDNAPEPLVLAFVDAAAAAASMLAGVAQALVAVAAYRRLAAR